MLEFMLKIQKNLFMRFVFLTIFFFFLTPSGTFVTVKLECLNAGSASIS